MVKTYVRLGYIPNERAEDTIDYAIDKINPKEDGMAMDVLLKAVSNCIPVVENEKTVTQKNILFVNRGECPCCSTSIEAIVSVATYGLTVPEHREVEGLYRIVIDSPYSSPEANAQVRVEKLLPQMRDTAKLDAPLARRDYKRG